MSSCLVFSSLKVESFHDVFSLISRILTVYCNPGTCQRSSNPLSLPGTGMFKIHQSCWYRLLRSGPLRSYLKELITISLVLGMFR